DRGEGESGNVNTSTLRAALIAAACLGLVAVVRLGAWPLVQVRLPVVADSVTVPTAAKTIPNIPTESVSAIQSHDPFRIGRRPTLPAYDPTRLAEQLAPPPPWPMLVLDGVMDGNPAAAVVEGLPGVEGSRVVRVGDVVGGLSIKEVANGRVVITGMDTTWVLQVREPWKN